MRIRRLAWLVSMSSLLLTTPIFGQVADSTEVHGKFNYTLGVQTVGTSNSQIPFWLRANRFGDIPTDGVSGGIYGAVNRGYDTSRKKKTDWGFGLSTRVNLGHNSRIIPIEAYIKGRLGIFQLKAGRSMDQAGLVDSTLSVGSFAISGNSLGIPKLEISIPEYYPIPLLGDMFALKGFISVGTMGKVPIQYGENKGSQVQTFFHSKDLHIRFGKPQWKIHVFGGINHQVMWGHDNFIFGKQYNLTTLNALYHVFTGKKYNPGPAYTGQLDISKIGNHLGAIDGGINIRLSEIDLLLYRQFFYDKGALYYLANASDGLTGLVIKNRSSHQNTFWVWNKFLLEFFYSKNQAGEETAKETPSGPEHYYNHNVYQTGYSYKSMGIGTPLITTATDARRNLPNSPLNYFINNRIIAFNVGSEGSISKFDYVFKLTYSQNFGDYMTSNVKHYWFNGYRYERTPVYGVFPEVAQFSGMLHVSKAIGKYRCGLTIATDRGKLLYNSMGTILSIYRKW